MQLALACDGLHPPETHLANVLILIHWPANSAPQSPCIGKLVEGSCWPMQCKRALKTNLDWKHTNTRPVAISFLSIVRKSILAIHVHLAASSNLNGSFNWDWSKLGAINHPNGLLRRVNSPLHLTWNLANWKPLQSLALEDTPCRVAHPQANIYHIQLPVRLFCQIFALPILDLNWRIAARRLNLTNLPRWQNIIIITHTHTHKPPLIITRIAIEFNWHWPSVSCTTKNTIGPLARSFCLYLMQLLRYVATVITKWTLALFHWEQVAKIPSLPVRWPGWEVRSRAMAKLRVRKLLQLATCNSQLPTTSHNNNNNRNNTTTCANNNKTIKQTHYISGSSVFCWTKRRARSIRQSRK